MNIIHSMDDIHPIESWNVYTHISALLVDALADTPVVLLNGVRQTGKSTLTQSLGASNSCRYLTMMIEWY
jgi:predicted AAA+ superfamily ATPase